MDQARYWMWAKRNYYKPYSNNPNNNNSNIFSPMTSYGDSWEEQAFAKDAAGALGGCVWPPRSYSCSFCRREFRSAQALGGHMNVHRRDRARLKQSPAPSPEVVPQNHSLTSCTSKICSTTLLYDISNPNLEFSEPRVSSPLCFSPPLVRKNDVVSMDPPSWSSFVAKNGSFVAKNGNKRFGQDCRVEKEDCVTEDLASTLSLIACRRTREDTCNNEEVASCKRRRIEGNPSSLFPKLRAVDRCVAHGPAEELDLELRLGFSAPKVK